MNIKLLTFIAVAAVTFSSFTANASPVTFDITGTVATTSTLPGFAIGQTVIGHVTFDLGSATTSTGSNYIQYLGAITDMQIAGFTATPSTDRNIIQVVNSPTYDQIVFAKDASAIAHVPIFYFQFDDTGSAPRNAVTDFLSTSWTSGIDPTSFNSATMFYIPDFQNWFSDQKQLTVNITSVALASSVPEPSTWAMMMLGFVAVGFLTFQRKQKMALLAG